MNYEPSYKLTNLFSPSDGAVVSLEIVEALKHVSSLTANELSVLTGRRINSVKTSINLLLKDGVIMEN